MTDFLLELLSEEIPARMQARAIDDLLQLFAVHLEDAGLQVGGVRPYVTPRRLALIAYNLPDGTEPVAEETKGPRVGAPPQALEGFLRKTGLTADQLTERDGVLYAVIDKPGRPTVAVLAEAIPAIIRAFPWPKSMRWGAGTLRWVRPLQGIVALLGETIVPFEIDGIASGAATVGHRFHHPGPITIGSADDYAAKLRACHVILDPAERRAIIEAGAAEAAAAAGLSVVPDPGLIAENAGLTEWPVPLLGSFDPAFLDVPREVIQLTMRTNQKYFACTDGAEALAPNFICTANIEALDGGTGIVAGNRKVLAARLADAKFFWEQDLKVPLAEQAKKLAGIVFHEKLGTVANKVERVAKLARWLVEEGIVGAAQPNPPVPSAVEGHSAPSEAEARQMEGIPYPPRISTSLDAAGPSTALGKSGEGERRARLADMAEQAARLCKVDLVTGMVGEFPELQGVMGGYYARAEGFPSQVADAIRDHYKPVGQGDEVPTAPVTVAVSLADKLDTVVSFYTAEMPPSGSRDPFALRRACLGAIHLIDENILRLRLLEVFNLVTTMVWDQRHSAELERDRPQTNIVERALRFAEIDQASLSDRQQLGLYVASHPDIEILDSGAPEKVLDFFADRLKVQQREAGVRHDLIDAVFALGGEDDLVRLLARVKALQAFVATEDGTNLLAGYKRAANILRIEEKKGGLPTPVTPAEAGVHSGSGPVEANDGTRAGVDSRLRGNDDEEGSKASVLLTDNNQMGYAPFPEEEALIHALNAAEPAATAAIASEDFEGAMRALAALRAPIDAFFEKVTVNDSDPAKRAARLGLLSRVRDAVHRVADFSKIEG